MEKLNKTFDCPLVISGWLLRFSKDWTHTFAGTFVMLWPNGGQMRMEPMHHQTKDESGQVFEFKPQENVQKHSYPEFSDGRETLFCLSSCIFSKITNHMHQKSL